MFSVFIDAGAHGLPSAVTYYQAFPSEPSPEGTIDFDPNTINAVRGMNLLGLLPALARAANRDILIVCHAFVPSGDGLYMPLAPETEMTAGVEALDLLVRMQVVEDVAAPVLKMSEKTPEDQAAKVVAWKPVFKAVDDQKVSRAAPVDNTFKLKQLNKAYDTVRADVAGRISLSVATMLALIQARRVCLGTPIQRLEFRACDLGRNPANLTAIKKYFGAAKATAPVLETFFHPGVRLATLRMTRDPNRPGFPLFPAIKGLFHFLQPLTDVAHRAQAHQELIFHPDEVLAETPLSHLDNHHVRGRASVMDIATNGAHQMYPELVVMFVWKYDEDNFRYEALAVTFQKFDGGPLTSQPNTTAIDAFVKANISKKGWTAAAGPPFAGLWNPTDGNDPFLVANDPKYLKSIRSA